MVLVPTPLKKSVYERIFNDGVIVVKKDSKVKEHRDFKGVSNLHVMMITKSLHSKGYLIEKFNWGYHYYFLSDEGVEFLRDYLHLDASAVPETHQVKTAKDAANEGEAEKEERPVRN
jgi:small subunit ribosomal protein S10e